MKKYINNLCLLVVAGSFLAIFMGGCKDTWDNHYMPDISENKELLLEKVEASADLSTFVGLLKKVGYDAVLMYPQAYTVFAPVNDAFSKISQDTLNNNDLLKALLGNHICRFSYSSVDAKGNLKLKMLNGKYEEFGSSGSQLNFAESELVSADNLCGNGIFHKVNAVVRVKPNIWNYMQGTNMFPSIMNYLAPYNNMVFDEFNSVAIRKNTLGETVYDSVFVPSNSYFDIIGDLNSEEKQYTFLGLPENVYGNVYNNIKVYFGHPDPVTVTNNVNTTIIDNLVLPAIAKNDLPSGYLVTTTGKLVKVDKNLVTQEVKLSNGYMFILNNLNLEPTKIMYKPERFEVEETEGRKIGKTSDFTIQKVFDITASGFFKNQVALLKDPDATGTNNYFEVSFNKVYSAAYDIYIKFTGIGSSKGTKLKYVLTYSKMDGTTATVNINGGVVGNDVNDRVKIGDTYNFPVYVNSLANSTYFVKLKVIVDVSSAELILYDRIFGIDYIELVPVP